VAGEPEPRLMAVNIDEGEPGTFKDRWYLELDPHRFLEGMLVAAWVVGISEIYVYLRDEYAGCRAILERELSALQKNPPCALPPIYLRRGPGVHLRRRVGDDRVESRAARHAAPAPAVCRTGRPLRPSHARAQIWNRCTWVREIVEKGPQWFSGHGRDGRKGLRSFSVSGRVKKPGVHVAPAGITVS